MRPSLLRRMIAAQGLTMLLAWLLLIGVIIGQLAWSKKEIWDKDVELMATSMAVLLKDEPDPSRLRLQGERLHQVFRDMSLTTGLIRPDEYGGIHQVFDRQGRLLARSATAPEAPLVPLVPGFHDGLFQDRKWRVFVKIEDGTGLRVLAGQPKSLAYLVVWRSLRQELPLQIVTGLAIVSLFTWLVVRRAVKPIDELAQAVEARDPGDLRPLEGFRELRETQPLIAALNRLFRRVDELLASQRRFVADAAHELRTPLAVIGAQAHVLRHASEGAQRESARKDLQAGVARAEQLVGQLLSVARLDDPAQALEPTPLDLARLARGRAALLGSEASAKGQTLVYEGPDSLPWAGDEAVLVSALDNLLMNAMRYTPEDGHIVLRTRKTTEGVEVEVEDDGPGIPEAFRETIFERFRRLPGSPGTGSGLGLAIVRQAVERHGGRVRLAGGRGGKGLRAVIRLPKMD